MTMGKTFLIFLLFLILQDVAAAAVSPSRITFEGLALNEETKGYFFILSPETEKTYILYSDCTQLKLPRTEIVKGTKKVEFMVKATQDKPYPLLCSIFVEEERSGRNIGVIESARIIVSINTTEILTPSLFIYHLDALPSEEFVEPLVTLGLENNGNMLLDPKVELATSSNTTIHHFGLIRPRERLLKTFLSNHLASETYALNVTALYANNLTTSKTTNLEVLPASAVYNLVFIDNVSITHGTFTTLSVLLRNDSPVPVKTRVRAEVYRNDDLVDVLESNETMIFENGEIRLYTKLKQGKYRIAVIADYNGKQTPAETLELEITGVFLTGASVVKNVGTENIVFALILLVLLIVGIRNRKKLAPSRGNL